MPGIYVRTLSQFDLLNQEKESLLSIPGSYWLCHKKNIYKFIFKYDRTVKNPMEFSYGRELLKIVRRIIKCHPSQGQQFGTPHLLVTYNCTSWTRQDKMFAILKFQQQTNAAAFSHAFVLTIKMYPSVKHSLFDDKYPIVKEADAGTTFKDLNVSLDTEEKIAKSMMAQVYTTDKVSPKKAAIYKNKQDQVLKYSTRTEDTFNETPETGISNFQDNVKNSDSFDESLNAPIKSATTTSKVQFITTEFQNTNENESTNCSIERNMNHGDMNVNKQTLFNGFGFHKNSMENNICLLNNKDTLDDSGKTISETNPTKDPDQYFVDCESEKHDKRSSFSTLRSSNITDLVMEGLMFTICQDKDSVTVIEQKTKLNEMIDEVLENSEKVETKTGEKCLLNSSLLKLENLVTMIDSPRSSSNITSSDSNLAKRTTTERSEELMEQQQNDDNQHTKKDINNIETEREKRKDIIPEVFPPTLFSSEKKNTGLQNGDLLMDDTDTRETSECEISVKRFYNSSLSSSPSSSSSSRKMFTKKENFVISAESDSTKLPQGQETNGPRIISDKAITMEQMSPALQKVLHTFRTRGLSRSDSKMLQYQEKTQYIAEESSSSKNSSPKKLQDITEDFYYDLLHARNKDNAIRQRCLRQKQRSLNDPDKNGKVRIEILKFIQDLTEGARVVVTRLNMDNKCC